MADNDTQNQNADKSKAGDPWSAEQTSATAATEQNEIAGNYRDRDGDEAGGISNRPIGEEVENQQSLPERGSSRDETGNGVGDEVVAEDDRESER